MKRKLENNRKKRVKKPSTKNITLWDQASRWYDSLVGSQGTDFQKDIIILQDEITKLSKLESSFILAAFFIQFIIFLLVQFFEITIEQGNIGRRKKK